jgi:hypothetical protein
VRLVSPLVYSNLAMKSSDHSGHGIYDRVVLDVDRHAGNEAPVGAVPKPQLGGSFELNDAAINGRSHHYPSSNFTPFLRVCLSYMIPVSPSRPGLKGPEHDRVWHVTLGPDRKNHG